jgi:hypothetical protein
MMGSGFSRTFCRRLIKLASWVVGLYALGCGTSPTPITGPASQEVPDSTNGNVRPSIQILSPSEPLILDQGTQLTIIWRDEDPDTNALVTLELDPDGLPNSGNEIVLFSNQPEDPDDPDGLDRYVLDTTTIPPDTYAIVARITDDLNPEVVVTGPALIRIVEAGLSPANAPPKVTVTQPTLNIGLGQGDVLVIEWTDEDPDSNANLIIVLDKDDDPTNDNINDPNDPGLIFLGRRTEDPDPTADTAPADNPDRFSIVVDVDNIPIRTDGKPYYIRITADDGVNPPVHSYASGTVRILTFATSQVVDLGQVGKTITGAVFQGFNTGANAGSEFVRTGDWSGDGTDDAIIVAQYGSGLGRAGVGMAYLLYGIPGQRLAGVTNVNEIGSSMHGTIFVGPENYGDKPTMGLTSAAVSRDITGDNKPDLLFGMPFISGIFDAVDPDPQDKGDPGECPICSGGGFYCDGLPDPYTSDQPADDSLGSFDSASGLPLDGGYAFFLSSNLGLQAPSFDGAAVDIGLIGQGPSDEGAGFVGVPDGTRWRGSWYDLLSFTSATLSDTRLTPDTQFGRTVASIPDMTSGFLGASQFKDGFDEILISVPFGLRVSSFEEASNRDDRPGRVIFQDGFAGEDDDRDRFENSGGVSSVPTFAKAGECSRGLDYSWYFSIVGEKDGDEFGWASSAGDFNRDGSTDILCGAPGADRDGKIDSGILYILFGSLVIGEPYHPIDLASQSPPRMEVHGDNGDRLGQVQTLIDDFNGGSVDDIAFGIPRHDSGGVPDSGMAGIILGGQLITGENIFALDRIATFELPGVIIEGEFDNQQFGYSVASAGDFNGDGLGDLVITAPGEVREVDGQMRRGVVYIVFGSGDLVNKRFLASQIGTAFLPGKVFVSPYEVGTQDEAAPIMAKGVGDVDGDGFDDVMIGNPKADFVDPSSPTQRRNDAGEVYLIYGNNL